MATVVKCSRTDCINNKATVCDLTSLKLISVQTPTGGEFYYPDPDDPSCPKLTCMSYSKQLSADGYEGIIV